MGNIFEKKTVCTTCNGEKTILCCSCGAVEGECQPIECPTCQGKGYLTETNHAMVAGVVTGVVVFVTLMLFL